MSAEKVEAYYAGEHHFKRGVEILRNLALKTKLQETFKWQAPVYVLDGKNVFWISKFKNHFGLGFFNGVFLSDPKNVLENVQEGKTVAMRHWKFTSEDEIDSAGVAAYMHEAIDNQKKGLEIKPKKSSRPILIPALLEDSFKENKVLKVAFDKLSPGKQRDYCEYLDTAKQEKTKLSRLEKIKPMISEGVGLHDMYRNC